MNPDSSIAANRFGLGALPGELDRIARDPLGDLHRQLAAGPRPAPAGLQNSATVFVELQALRRKQRAAADDGDALGEYAGYVRTRYLDQVLARYRMATGSENSFVERLVHFWANHFAVSADKQPIAAVAGLYENEAIRPNVLGNFADLLFAATSHPAMLAYLDNVRSAGPGSTLARRASRRRSNREFGLNENLAREVLELHTLGVDGGYTQADVTELARVLTGWSIGGATDEGRFADGDPGRFHFRAAMHEPGDRRVLGLRYAEDGVAQGRAVLRDLAVHPATARHVAQKLARHFVADEPPADLVDELARTYLDAGGELRPVYAALIDSEQAWRMPAAKYKTPHELVVSAYRALDAEPDSARRITGGLGTLGQVPYKPGSPAGWPDTAAEWGGADALYKRIEWVSAVARLAGRRTDPAIIGDGALGAALTARTREAVARAESTTQGLALLLASPDFQRR